jgi:hypothetical protein
MQYRLSNSKLILAGLLFSLIMILPLTAQTFDYDAPVEFRERNLSGPRLGITYIPGQGELVNKLDKVGIGTTLSQFGWHFEYQVVPKGGGPSFIIEFIPMVAAVEYGTPIPSATLAMGIRLPNGIEFGLGPNVMVGMKELEKDKELAKKTEPVLSALTIAIGKSINYSGVSIPINLVFTTNPKGNRISLIFGYAIAN